MSGSCHHCFQDSLENGICEKLGLVLGTLLFKECQGVPGRHKDVT